MRLLWLSALTCHGNVHSFLNYQKLEQFLEDFEFIYHPILDSKYSLKEIYTKNISCDILLIDGTLQNKSNKYDVDFYKVVRRYAKRVKKIITVGTCATFGGIFADDETKQGFLFKKDVLSKEFMEFEKKTISVSGCPIHPDILVNTLYSIKKEYPLHFDKYNRVKEYYGFTNHNGCVRNEYFEYKIDDYEYGNTEGCLFYEHGCQAPFTHGSCNRILWNEVNSKTRSGSACFGCTEPSFPRENLFSTKKNMGMPEYLPIGVPKRAYLTLAGISKAFKIDRFREKIID